MLLVEQNAARTIEIADRTYVMRAGGRIEFHGTPEELAAAAATSRPPTSGCREQELLATVSNVFQYAADSIYYGSFFALISLSLSLLFGVMGLMNFAYGELIMAGAYVMFYTRSWGWLAMVVMVILIVKQGQLNQVT